MKTFYVKHSSIVVPDYDLGESVKLEGMLSVFDDVYYKMKPVGFQYDKDTRTLYLPRGLDVDYLEKLLQRRAELVTECNPDEKALIRLLKEPKNEIQQKSIAYLLGEGDFKYTQRKSQLSLTLDTGDGKTYCVIAALTFMRTRSLVMTHIDNIKKQWIESMLKFTDIPESYLLDIKGSKAMEKILATPQSKLPWRAYFVNRKTINSFAKKHGWDKVDEFMKHIQIGVKVFDEAHIEFETMMHIDFHSNVKKTIYLTANFERSEFRENKVFELAFKNSPKFGISTRADKERHINYVPVFYSTRPSMDAKIGMRGLKGWLDKNKYSDYLMEREEFFDVLKRVMDICINQEGRILIMSSKINSTKIIADYIEETYGRKVGVYNSSIDDKLKEEIKESYEIISSTPKSMGTGTDIPGLRFVLNFDVYSSTVLANQVSGRLRALPDGKDTFFFEFVDQGVPDVEKMYKKRLKVFKKKCKSIKQLKF